MTQWLLDRLFHLKDYTQPRFAFQGTVNWMRALSILIENKSFENDELKEYYKLVKRRKHNPDADTLVFENMMMAFHNQASLVHLAKNSTHPYDVCRSAIIEWYYSTYFTCSAMIAAASGSVQETHAGTIKAWQFDIVKKGLVIPPFSLSLSSLVEKVAKAEILAYRDGNKYDLNTYPENENHAYGAIISYMSGTWDYEKSRIEEKIRRTTEFKDLNVKNFRTKKAGELRDKQLAKHQVNYLVQAFRYRGKANYRDSIFLSYGADNSKKIDVFLKDLEKVSFAFQRMAAHYLSQRVEKDTWNKFISDLKENSRLSLDTTYLVL